MARQARLAPACVCMGGDGARGAASPANTASAAPGGHLGFARGDAHNPDMDPKSDNPQHGFQVPGTFELSAMGSAEKDLETVLPTLLLDAGIEVLHETVTWKHSSNGRYVSVRIAFRAESREQYDAAHAALRAHPEVKWTL